MTKDGTIKGVESTCRFNYNVTLSGDAGNEGRLKISGITLNESKKLH